MSQTFDDIDCLVARLKTVARQHEQAPGQQPPPFAYRERLGQLLQQDSPAVDIGDPRHPRLEELFAADHDDPRFLDRAYRLLLGRPVDHEGLHHYQSLLPRAGRLYVLAKLLCSGEARDYLARHNVTVPHRGPLTLPLRIAGRLGPLGRALRALLRPLYRLAAILARPRLRLRGRLSQLEARSARRDALLHDVLLELDGELTQQNERHGERLGRLERHDERHGERLDELEQRGDRHQQSLDQLEQQGAQHAHRLGEQERTLPAYWSALQHHRRAVQRLLDSPETVARADEGQQQALDQQLFDAYYLAFEDACRGSEAEIREHLLRYQPQLDAARLAGKRAMDLGCGRGEWLTLLAEQGFSPSGVDLNIAMIEHCRELGHNVQHTDILDALRQQDDESHALISAFHIAEHLPFEALYAMVDEAQRVLAPGGVLIIETPNPENLLVGSHTFFHDPTHRNPLTPTAMRFLLDFHGFAAVEVRRFNPYPESAKVPGDDPLTERVNGHLCGPQDFAVVGLKAAPVEVEPATDAEDAPASQPAPQEEHP